MFPLTLSLSSFVFFRIDSIDSELDNFTGSDWDLLSVSASIRFATKLFIVLRQTWLSFLLQQIPINNNICFGTLNIECAMTEESNNHCRGFPVLKAFNKYLIGLVCFFLDWFDKSNTNKWMFVILYTEERTKIIFFSEKSDNVDYLIMMRMNGGKKNHNLNTHPHTETCAYLKMSWSNVFYLKWIGIEYDS